MTVRLKRGDTRTAIRATLVGPDGDPADLSSATRVRFLLADGRREIYPTGGYLQIEIIPDLG